MFSLPRGSQKHSIKVSPEPGKEESQKALLGLVIHWPVIAESCLPTVLLLGACLSLHASSLLIRTGHLR